MLHDDNAFLVEVLKEHILSCKNSIYLCVCIFCYDSGELLETLGCRYRKGAGILDIQWETSHTLLACGYDAYIRLWDTRASYQ